MSPWRTTGRVERCALRIAVANAGSIASHSGRRSGSLPSVVTGTIGEVTASTTSYSAPERDMLKPVGEVAAKDRQPVTAAHRDLDRRRHGRAVDEHRDRPAPPRRRAALGLGPRFRQHGRVPHGVLRRDRDRLRVAAREAVGAERQQGGLRTGAAHQVEEVGLDGGAGRLAVVRYHAHQGGDLGGGGAGLRRLHHLGEGVRGVPRRVAEHGLGGRPVAPDREPRHPAVVPAAGQSRPERHRHAGAKDHLARAPLDHYRLAGGAVDVEDVAAAPALHRELAAARDSAAGDHPQAVADRTPGRAAQQLGADQRPVDREQAQHLLAVEAGAVVGHDPGVRRRPARG